MTDRQLLTLAAKAAGKTIHHWSTILPGPMMADPVTDECSHYWNPLEEDGDALRLAVKLRLTVEVYPWGALARQWDAKFTADALAFPHEDHDDPNAATRLAIVMVAAEIGKTTP